MNIKSSQSKMFVFLSFILSLLGLFFFVFYKLNLSQYISLDVSKSIILTSFSILALLLYAYNAITKKETVLAENKWVRVLFIAFPTVVILSSIFSGDFYNSFFGKYVYLQSGITYISIFVMTYIAASYFKLFKRISWILFVLANLFISIGVILGIIFSKLNYPILASKLVHFIENWDLVAVVSGVVIMFSLVYYETIASTRFQKIFSGILVVLHLILLSLIIIPDVWYSLLFSSLFIMLMLYKNRNREVKEESKIKTKIYNKLSFYVFIVSLLFSFVFIFSNSFTSKIATSFINFTNKYSNINYNFVKPKLNLSLSLGGSELLKGKIFGAGPSQFYKVWQNEKPQSVINSAYWDTNFSSSYSALTTIFVSFGVVGLILFIMYIVVIGFGITRKIKKQNENIFGIHEEENKFYFLAGSSLFIYSAFLFIFFSNILISIALLSISTIFIASYISKWKEMRTSRFVIFLLVIILVILIAGESVTINRMRASYITNKSIANFQSNNDINTLEDALVRSAQISNQDTAYRLLSQFYVFKTRQILSTTATDTNKDLLQKEVLTSINNAITSANMAINIDPKDYNNYISLAQVNGTLMTFDQQNREVDYQNAKNAYNKALEINPKNPSIYLALADLEYAYTKNIDNTVNAIGKSLEIKPNYSSAFYLLSQLAVQTNNREAALNYAIQAIQSDPKNVDAYLQFGILTLNKKELTQDELNKAYTAFVSVLQIDPNNLTAAYYLTVTYILAKDWERSESMISTLKQILPNDQRIEELQTFLTNAKSENTTTAVPTTENR